MTVELRSKQGCKILRDTVSLELDNKYNIFVNKLKSKGGFVHGSQSHVTPKPNTYMFEYTIFIYYELPKDADIQWSGQIGNIEQIYSGGNTAITVLYYPGLVGMMDISAIINVDGKNLIKRRELPHGKSKK